MLGAPPAAPGALRRVSALLAAEYSAPGEAQSEAPSMDTTDAALLAALLVLMVFLLARWHASLSARRSPKAGTRAPRPRPRNGAFCAGPSNIGLYDHPYYYPTYEARLATSWDQSRRCAAYCGIGDCAVWCR